MLHDQLLRIIKTSSYDSEDTRNAYLERLEEGTLTRDENPKSHFCVYFLPLNKGNGEVFIIHHKKSNHWLSPGGHIDRGEELLETLNREINEELGVRNFFEELPAPFLLTTTSIDNTTQPCRIHFDIWYLVDTDGSDFKVDPKEFHDFKWMAIDEAMKIVVDPANLKALGTLDNIGVKA